MSTMKPGNARAGVIAAAALAVALGAGQGMAQDKTLKASHQWPGGKGDVRDEMVQIIAKEVAAADVGLDVRVYPGASLMKPKQQWDGLTSGQLDISAFPLDYASGQHPEFSATLMPGLVRNHERAQRLNDSPFMEDIKAIIDEAGVHVLADAWLAGGFVGKEKCIKAPADAEGMSLRAAGPAFEQMLAAAGASISAMPSSEIYSALQTGVLDGANTSSGSLVSYRIYEQVACLTEPGENALWFMYEPILVSKKTWESLTPEQQDALTAAGEKAEEYFVGEAKKLDSDLVKAYKDAGVEVVSMSEEDYNAWLDTAKKSAYQEFANNIEGGQELIDKALAVE